MAAPGTHNEPQVAATDPFNPPNDINNATAFAKLVGNQKVGTAAQRIAALGTTQVWEGLVWTDTDAPSQWRMQAGAWVIQNIPEFLTPAALNATTAVEGAIAYLKGDTTNFVGAYFHYISGKWKLPEVMFVNTAPATTAQFRIYINTLINTNILVDGVAGVAGSGISLASGEHVWSNSGTWLTLQPGLTGVKPSSVVGGVTATAGSSLVTFGGVNLVRINGVFSSFFRYYRVMIDIFSTTSAGYGNWRLSAGGADDITANYSYQEMYFQGTTVTAWAAPAGGTSFTYAPLNGIEHQVVIELTNPWLPYATRMQLRTNTTSVPGTQIETSVSGRFNSATSFDGFVLLPSAGLITGTIQVFGYNNT